jgi:hypothetical protein
MGWYKIKEAGDMVILRLKGDIKSLLRHFIIEFLDKATMVISIHF